MKNLVILSILSFALASQSSIYAQGGLQFDKIKIAGSATVELKQGEAGFIVNDGGSGSNMENICSITPDGWLVVNGKKGDEVVVTAPMISKIDMSGSGKLESENTFKAEDIELTVSGVGKIELNLDAEMVKCVISGAGKMELEGSAKTIDIDISGAGKIDGENFKVHEATVNISGSGKCLLDVSEALTANISGSGSVYYVKAPNVVNKNISGIGKVGDASVSVTDTTKISLGKHRILIVDDEGRDIKHDFKDVIKMKSDKVKGHWAGFELGVNMLMDKDYNTSAPEGYDFLELNTAKSIAVNFNLADFEIKLYRRNIMLITGLGFTLNNYRFKSDAYLVPGADSVIAFAEPDVNIKKNKLAVNYMTVPLLLEFNTSQNPKKTVHFAVGMIGGLKLGSHLKLVREVDGDNTKSKIHNNFNLNTWRYDGTVRLGYRNFTVFGSYDFAGLFKDNKGPELHPFTAGIRLVGW